MPQRTRKLRPCTRPARIRLQFVTLEDRLAPAVTSFGGDAQHGGVSAVATQAMQAVHWQTSLDAQFPNDFGHYGAPLVTDANTVIYPYKTGANPNPPNFHVLGKSGNDGSTVWDVTTDWRPSSYTWYPPLQAALSPSTGRVYFAGRGGTIYYRTNPDSATGTITQVPFYGTLAQYTANKTTYDNTVFVDTPITADSQGNIFFGFRVTGANPANLVSGIARISVNGTGTWVSAETAAQGDTAIDELARNSAPALSTDGATVYVCVRNATSGTGGARLVGLNSTTLATQFRSGLLKDPRDGGANPASITSQSTASPMVGPDGRVFYGIMANPSNGSRGWLLQYSGDLTTQGTPGGFGWDTTPSIIPRSMVPQYTGTAPYLLFNKYNNYVNTGESPQADGSHRIAILDPFDSEVEFHSSSNGQLVMKRVLSIVSPTPDPNYPNPPLSQTAKTEWCVNHAMVDPATSSVIVNNEDGKFYRWDLPTNTITETVTLAAAYAEPYTMTVIGTDGTIYGLHRGMLVATGKTPGLSVSDVSVANNGTSAVFTVTLDFPRIEAITVHYATADGSAVAGTHYTNTFGDLTFNPGQKSKTVTVNVVPGSVTGVSANFFLNLTSPANANLVDAQGQATIQGQPLQVQNFGVNDGTQQRSRVTSLTVTFNAQVDFAGAVANAFSLTRNGGTSVNFAATANVVGGVTVVTLDNFGGAETQFGSLADGRYTLTANALQISSGGQFLNGGNNVTFGDAQGLYRFFGDTNGDRRIDIADFGPFSTAYNRATGDPLFNPIFDFNADGRIDISDFGQFSVRYFTNLA